MSITTKTGDNGTTNLLFNRRVPKGHPRVEACGAVDELNAALGLARAFVKPAAVRGRLLAIQQDLVTLMGELAADPKDWPRFKRAGFQQVTPAMIARLEQWIRQLETAQTTPRGWAMPGATPAAATLDLARTVCRRAERRGSVLKRPKALKNNAPLMYLNRLSDLLWLLARRMEPAGRTRRNPS